MNFGTTEIILIFGVLFIFCLPVIILVSVMRRNSGKLKKCPYCAEHIQPEAIVCRYCNRGLAGIK